jgi:hypothetical protein
MKTILKVHLITSTNIKFEPLLYLTNFQNVSFHSKWEKLGFKLKIELKIDFETWKIFDTYPTLDTTFKKTFSKF